MEFDQIELDNLRESMKLQPSQRQSHPSNGRSFFMSSCESKLLEGTLEHVASVAKRRTGKRPHPSSIWRWVKKGMRGGTIKLPAIYHSGYWQTTDAAFDSFLQAQTEAAFADSETDGNVSDDELKAAGLL